MQITPRQILTQFSHLLQTVLFPVLEQEVGPLTPGTRLLAAIVSRLPLAKYVLPCRGYVGHPREDRQSLAISFLAKAVLGLPTTRDLIDRLQADSALRHLCGWKQATDLPHESTFSRAFAEFAATELPQRLHEVLIASTQKDRLVGHIARDSTAIEVRERYDTLPKHKPLPPRVVGRPKKGGRALPSRRLPRQRRQSLTEMLVELPRHCSLGVKTASDGNQRYWRGYKLHLDVADGQIPISCLLTAASLHDSQVAIPLATITAQRVTSLYDLMDSAYDANEIHQHSRSLGHVPIIAWHERTVPISKKHAMTLSRGDRRRLPSLEKLRKPGKRPPLTPAQEQRLHERTMVERVFSRIKDEFGGRHIRVRGAAKVMAHLMFAVLALSVDQWLKLCG
jgi:Transposase DDE domain/Transposase domain (DUF772)